MADWFNFIRPKIKTQVKERNDIPQNLWRICKNCGHFIYNQEFKSNVGVCSHCGYHNNISMKMHFDILLDAYSEKTIPLPEVLTDPIKFVDSKPYKVRLKSYREKVKKQDAFTAVTGTIRKHPVVLAGLDFSFMGGSMGLAVGEGFLTAVNTTVENQAAFIVITASGGARMQEGIYSLIQMIRTTVGVNKIKKAHLPYIVLLTNPTTGGVSASFAMLGDLHISEPGAIIGFTGRRVIEQTVREQLPKDFQTAEYLEEHGMIDAIVNRKDQSRFFGDLLDIIVRN